jgi:prolipoprotein diacylglyceryltransferase
MHQVLFRIPFTFFGLSKDGITIFGYGAMLFLAFACCTLFVAWRAKKLDGFEKDKIYDMAFWIFLCGILGARIVFMIQYKVPFWDFYKVWEGGIVFYGSAIGGWVAYALYRFWVRKTYRFSTWKLADHVAPTVCLGLILGRIGCLLNGCCYGQVCPECRWPTFPTMTAPARELTVEKRVLQLTAGFATLPTERPEITSVEPNSAAKLAGLQEKDQVVEVNGIKWQSPLVMEALEVNGNKEKAISLGPNAATDFAVDWNTATVTSVSAKSIAEIRGLKVGDRIASINGNSQNLKQNFDQYLAAHFSPSHVLNSTYAVTVIRNAKREYLKPFSPIGSTIGFLFDYRFGAEVDAVEPHSPAANAGLLAGDEIEAVNGEAINSVGSLEHSVSSTSWPRGQSDVSLTVRRNGQKVDLPAFAPRTISLQPTQVYESISMFLLMLLLLAYFPYRRYYGEAFALLMLCYAIHRFLNESLRDDTAPVLRESQIGVNLTLSQVISIVVFSAGVILWIALRRISERVTTSAKPTPA